MNSVLNGFDMLRFVFSRALGLTIYSLFPLHLSALKQNTVHSSSSFKEEPYSNLKLIVDSVFGVDSLNSRLFIPIH